MITLTEFIVLMAISILSITGYILYIIKNYGIQTSISASYYNLSTPLKYLFTLALWGTAVPLIIIGDTILMFIAGTLIVIASTAPGFRGTKLENQLHMWGAGGGYAFGIASMLVEFQGLYVMLAAALLVRYVYKYCKNTTWWAELIGIYAIHICLILFGLLNYI